MATLGSTPSFGSWRWSDSGTSCATAPDQVKTNSTYTMPSAGWVTAVNAYVSGDGASTTIYGCVWNSGNGLIGNSAGTGVGSGSRALNAQAWRTLATGFFLANGSVIFIGWMKPTGSTMVWSETSGGTGGRWGYNGSVPGNYVDCGAVGGIGAYITYNPISNPSATTNAATSVGTTTATLNGTVGDGGQNGSGDPNSSHYYFQYGTDPTFATTTTTSSIAFNGTGQAASQGITGLAVNTTYYCRVVAVNDAGTTFGSSTSFTTNGLPNAPTLTSPANGTALNAQSGSVAFAWTYNSGGAVGGETAYALKLTTGGVDQWWNGTGLQSTQIYVAEATTKTIPAGILAPSVTYLWTVSSQDAGGTGPYASQFTLVSEGPPAAPTLQSPTSGTYVEMSGATPTFAWLYNPGNAVGGQTAFAIRQKISGAGSYQYYNVGTSSWQSTIVWNTQTAQSFTFPAGKWVDGNTYNWSVATQDAGGQGPFASDYTLIAQAVPVVTALSPSGSVAAAKPAITWSVSYPSGAGEVSYQVRTFSAAQYGAGGFNPATSTAIDDSGVVSSGSATSYQVQTALPPGTSYRSYIQVTETGAEPSGFVAFAGYTVTTDLPPTPALTAVASTDPVTGCPLIQLTAQSAVNLLSAVDASFETGVGTYVGGNSTLAQSSVQALDGTFSLALTATTAADAYARSGFYAILPATLYSYIAYFRAATTGRSVQVVLQYFDSTHTLIGTTDFGTLATDTTTGWTQAIHQSTSPSNAAYVQIMPYVGAPAASEVHYIDEVGIFPGAVSVWTAGGFLSTDGIVILRSDGVYVRGASTANPAPPSTAPVSGLILGDGFESDVPNTQTLFKSIGTDATGTLNAWTTDSGSPTISANVVTLPAAQIRAAHPDLWDCIFLARVSTNATVSAQALVHATSGTSYITGYLGVGAGTGTVNLGKNVGGTFSGVASTGALTIAASTFYWLKVQASGTTYTVSVYADSAGAQGALIASCTGTISDVSLQSGQVGLRTDGANTCTAGGAFAGVCQVTGPLPVGWSTNIVGGEPAFCWSKATPYAGQYSLSIYNAHTSGSGQFISYSFNDVGSSTVSCAMRGTGSPSRFAATLFNGPQLNGAANGSWAVYQNTQTGQATDQVYLPAAGAGTYYFDSISVSQGTLGTPTVQGVVVNDYEVTPLTAYTYQALVQATGAQGQVQSGYSAAAGASVTTSGWWELDPTNPGSAVDAQVTQFNPSITEQSAAHQVLGQQTMNIIASAMMATDMTAIFEVFDAPTYTALMALITSQKTIFFSDPFGHSYYFRIAPGPGGMSGGVGNRAHDTQLLPSTAAAPHRTVNITGVAQPRPAV